MDRERDAETNYNFVLLAEAKGDNDTSGRSKSLRQNRPRRIKSVYTFYFLSGRRARIGPGILVVPIDQGADIGFELPDEGIGMARGLGPGPARRYRLARGGH